MHHASYLFAVLFGAFLAPRVKELNPVMLTNNGYSTPPDDQASSMETDGEHAPALALRNATVTFNDFIAVSKANLEVHDGEFVCLLGPSGCGKSTLLSVMASFNTAAEGDVERYGLPATSVASDVGFVFQTSDALFDWLTVWDNVGFGPRMAGMSKQERANVIKEHVQLVGLEQAVNKRPPHLSGGMRQRVQIARVLANAPGIVLMDEPFGALDAQTRIVMQHELDRIWRERRSTVVFVTHDIDEALVLADRIAVMTAGPEANIKSTYQIDLERPRNEDSADYVTLRHKIREDISNEVARSMDIEVSRGDV